jgi:hypothetical protein
MPRDALGVRDDQGDGWIMASVEEYRRHAAECLSLAKIAENADDRSRLLQMAEAWRELAARLERMAEAEAKG